MALKYSPCLNNRGSKTREEHGKNNEYEGVCELIRRFNLPYLLNECAFSALHVFTLISRKEF